MLLFIQQWKEESKGVLSWFSGDDGVPPLIDSSNLCVSPWASYALLLVEQQSHLAFYEALYQTISKHPKNSLDQSVKVFIGETDPYAFFICEFLHKNLGRYSMYTVGVKSHRFSSHMLFAAPLRFCMSDDYGAGSSLFHLCLTGQNAPDFSRSGS